MRPGRTSTIRVIFVVARIDLAHRRRAAGQRRLRADRQHRRRARQDVDDVGGRARKDDAGGVAAGEVGGVDEASRQSAVGGRQSQSSVSVVSLSRQSQSSVGVVSPSRSAVYAALRSAGSAQPSIPAVALDQVLDQSGRHSCDFVAELVTGGEFSVRNVASIAREQ